MSIKIAPRAPIKVLTNMGTSDQEVLRFLNKNQKWVEQNLLRAQEYEKRLPKFMYCDGEEYLFSGKLKKLRIEPNVGAKSTIEVLEDKILFKASNPSSKEVRFALVKLYQKTAQRQLIAKALDWSESLGLIPKQIRLRNMSSRWGSCTQEGKITLSLRLMGAPDWVQDYVIVHELCHLKYLNHSRDFWSLVEKSFTRWKDAELWLKEHGRKLDFLESK